MSFSFPEFYSLTNFLDLHKTSKQNSRKIILLTVFVFGLGSFLGENHVLGMEDQNKKKQYIDFQKYTGNRLLVFNDTQIDYCVTKNDQNPYFDKIAVDAVKTWQKRIVEVTQNPYVWNMTTHLYPQDESICDGYVNFLGTPSPTLFQISGVMGFSHPQTPVANVTIYTDDYQNTLKSMAQNDENFWDDITLEKFKDIIKNHDHKQMSSKSIKRITLHEIGHSLSLNHPKTLDGNLYNVTGIMGYDMTYDHIDDDEVIEIVKAYPNGFTKTKPSKSIHLENPHEQILTLGEISNLTIELPNQDNLSYTGVEVYIFPEGTQSQFPINAPIKITQTASSNQIINDGIYFDDIQSALIHWDDSKVLSLQFKIVKEFENADLILVAHKIGGFEEQWFLDNVVSVQKGLFSDLLLELDVKKYQFFLKGSNPNRGIEQESAFKIKRDSLYMDALRQCLSEKNMKKCSDEISINDFG